MHRASAPRVERAIGSTSRRPARWPTGAVAGKTREFGAEHRRSSCEAAPRAVEGSEGEDDQREQSGRRKRMMRR